LAGRSGVERVVRGRRSPRLTPAGPPPLEFERLIREKVSFEEYKVRPAVDAPEASGGSG
jgi:hypothetical protein